ncbi:hypothetical protein [Streptomyces sp. G45]|uniref:hypothetical protein n=1 Tax=Streptomyces sp. G45 TaxID=3406627 RepID=UPI003C1B4F55
METVEWCLLADGGQQKTGDKMRRRIAVALGVSALVSIGSLGLTTTATAAPTQPSGASAGVFRGWEHDNFTGRHADFYDTFSELGQKNWEATNVKAQNGISSVENQSDSNVVLYDIGSACVGDNYFSAKHTNDGNLTNNGFDNKASCVKFV